MPSACPVVVSILLCSDAGATHTYTHTTTTHTPHTHTHLSNAPPAEQDHYDVKMPCHLMLSKLAATAPGQLGAVLDRLAEPLSATLTAKVKSDAGELRERSEGSEGSAGEGGRGRGLRAACCAWRSSAREQQQALALHAAAAVAQGAFGLQACPCGQALLGLAHGACLSPLGARPPSLLRLKYSIPPSPPRAPVPAPASVPQ